MSESTHTNAGTPRPAEGENSEETTIDIGAALASLDPQMVQSLSAWFANASNGQDLVAHEGLEASGPAGALEVVDLSAVDESLLEQLANIDPETLAEYIASLPDKEESRTGSREHQSSGYSEQSVESKIVNASRSMSAETIGDDRGQPDRAQISRENTSPRQPEAEAQRRSSSVMQNSACTTQSPNADALTKLQQEASTSGTAQTQGHEKEGIMLPTDQLKQLSEVIVSMNGGEKATMVNRLLQEVSGQAQSDDEAAPEDSYKHSESPEYLTEAEGPAPQTAQSSSLINVDLSSIPNDPDQYASWIAAQLMKAAPHLSAAASVVGNAPDPTTQIMTDDTLHASDPVGMSEDQHHNTFAGSSRRHSTQRSTDLEKERIREENRERKKRWREVNQDRNKDNDLRCRVTKRAQKIFGNVDSSERRLWMQQEFEKRRAKREAKQKCRISDDMTFSTYMSTTNAHANGTPLANFASNLNNNSSRAVYPTTQPYTVNATPANPTEHSEGHNLTIDSEDNQKLAALVASLASVTRDQGHNQNTGNTALNTGSTMLSNREGSQDRSESGRIMGDSTNVGSLFEAIANLEAIADVNPTTIAQIKELAKDIDLENLDPASIQAILEQSAEFEDQRFDMSESSGADEEDFKELLRADPKDVAQLLKSVNDRLGTSGACAPGSPSDVHVESSVELRSVSHDIYTEIATPKAPPPTPVKSRKRPLADEATPSPTPKRHQKPSSWNQQLTSSAPQMSVFNQQNVLYPPIGVPYNTPNVNTNTNNMNNLTIPKPPLISKPRASTPAYAASFGNSAAMNQRLMMPPSYRPPSNYSTFHNPNNLNKKRTDEKIVRSMGFPPMLAGLKKS